MFIHTYHPQPILFDFGFLQIHWYGFLISLAVVMGFFVFYQLAKRAGFSKNFIFNLSFWLITWGLIAGRLYHVLSQINYYFRHPLEIFYIWQGGLGIYGALIAGTIIVFYFSKKLTKKNPYYSRVLGSTLLLLDLLSPALALSQSLGRWGNYFNQELYGWPTNLPWGIPIDMSNRIAGYESFEFFHPIFLYESIFCLVIFFISLFLIRRHYGRDEAHLATGQNLLPHLRPGYIFICYILLYSSWRFFLEFLRIDPQPVFWGLRLGQWSSLIFIVFLTIIYFWKNHLINSKNMIK